MTDSTLADTINDLRQATNENPADLGALQRLLACFTIHPHGMVGYNPDGDGITDCDHTPNDPMCDCDTCSDNRALARLAHQNLEKPESN